ncbi:MAG: UDP-3-O-(3-hydroxymyristoyl)glucosamine N-acyltransferase [Candidatus Omnitrophica bacterium]|nr:UDP-3-O-(3-hydroxymyristoyl)glucosamine N-acyltransferase [Candidatus Omnitrophota bacterium]
MKKLGEIAAFVGGEVVGDAGVVIRGIAGIKEAREGDITFLANTKYFPLLEKTRASAVITSRDVSSPGKNIIRTDNPSLAFSKIAPLICPYKEARPKGIHPAAVLGKDVSLGKNAAIGACAVLEEGVSIGDNSVIYPGCYIGAKVRIGSDTLIYANVSIRENVVIGERVIIHSGAVIGSDGFGFVAVEGKYHKIPQVGTVEIQDEVEIGANVTIDRARFDKTVIGRGTKIDNLVQIAHNVIIGENSIIVAQVGIAGSAAIGKGVTIAGQAGIAGHIKVGDGVTIAGKAGVTKSLPEKGVFSGYPARPHAQARRVNACMQNLPRLYEAVSSLKKKIEKLESMLKGRQDE